MAKIHKSTHDLWRSLAKEFRALDPSGCIFAEWRRDSDTGFFRYTVQKDHDSCESELHQFTAVAARAGATYPADPDLDPCSRWLYEVNGRLSISQKEEPYRISDGTLVGRISRICEISANVCKMLEVQYLNSEPYANTRPIPSQQLTPEVHHPITAERESATTVERPSIAEQIELLRIESGVTQEKLAELVGLEVRTVQRHLSGDTTPKERLTFRYEQQFSKLLNKQVVLSKLP